jgi:hypothetical protein
MQKNTTHIKRFPQRRRATFDGPAIQRWPSPDCFATGGLKNGRRDGRWLVFGQNGQLIAVTLWRDGELVHADESFGGSRLKAA